MSTVSEFHKRTGYDIESFFQRFVSFYERDYPIIQEYFSGNSVIGIRDAFVELKYLISESNRVSSLIDINRFTLSEDISFWDLLNQFEDIKIRLKTILNLPKYLRSTYYNFYDRYYRMSYVSSQNDTPESITRKFNLGDENSWIDLILSSNLEETDYSHEGGSVFRLNVSSKSGVDIKSVVDVITGENVLGKDILNEIQYEDDDLKYLQPIDTINQSAEILLSLRRGDTPEFFELGVDLVEGTTKSAFDYPIVLRQLIQSFSTDDSFDSVELIDMKNDQDSISIVLQINTKIAEASLVKEYSI